MSIVNMIKEKSERAREFVIENQGTIAIAGVGVILLGTVGLVGYMSGWAGGYNKGYVSAGNDILDDLVNKTTFLVNVDNDGAIMKNPENLSMTDFMAAHPEAHMVDLSAHDLFYLEK